MGKLGAMILGICIWAIPLAAMSADFDGSVPLICAVIDVMECDPVGGCEVREVEDIDLPQFVRIDFEGKKITTTRAQEGDRSSAMRFLERMDGVMILQGAENGRGWSMAIVEETGKMSAAAVGAEAGFVVFGACTPD